jgi:enamine deaminase RidA (YjgF/YER057c/UK114 family)
MSRQIRAPGLFPGAPYADATIVEPAALVVTAGACPLDEAGVIVAPGDVGAQARQAVANLFRVLEAAGSSPGAVVKTTVYVATSDRAELVSGWDAVKESFGHLEPPSTLLGVSALGYPDQLVEIEAVALVETNKEEPCTPD